MNVMYESLCDLIDGGKTIAWTSAYVVESLMC